jgi:hypothetical protein
MNETTTEYQLPVHAWYLGLAGLIPFVGLPLACLLDLLSYSQGAFYFKQYSAIILSFLGGVLWLNALMERHTSHMIFIAMLPSIIGWFAVCFIPTQMALAILVVAFASLVVYERQFLLIPQQWVKSYSQLRMTLTAVVAASHFVMTIID